MSIYQEIYDKFVELLGEPSSEESLKEYILFVFDNRTSKSISEYYCEDHHIIPRSLLENDLCYTLSYANHVKAHVLLACAYPIAKFMKPLNFMLNRKEKETIEFRKMWSKTIKKWWVNFRHSEGYGEWKRKRLVFLKSEKNLKHIKEVMTPASLEAQKDPVKEAKRIKAIKSYWTDDRREQKSKDMKEYNRINGTQRYTDALNKRWKEISDEDYKKFCETMDKVNKDPKKRLKAGKKIKYKWDNDKDYQNKMKNRNPRGSDGTKIREVWNKPGFKEKQIKIRKLARIKKKAPPEIQELILSMSDDEIIEQYGHLSKKPYTKTPNTELKNRIEVDIIKEYKNKNKISKDPLTNRGWYRKSTTDLISIIKEYYNRYGYVNQYKNEIRDIINETN